MSRVSDSETALNYATSASSCSRGPVERAFYFGGYEETSSGTKLGREVKKTMRKKTGIVDLYDREDFDLMFFHTEEYPFKIVQDACASLWCHVALAFAFTPSDIREMKLAVCNRAEKERFETPISSSSSADKKASSVSLEPLLPNLKLLLDAREDIEACAERYSRDKPKEKREAYVFESTTDVYPCAVTGWTGPGVKICKLTERLKGWGGGPCGIKRAIIENNELYRRAKRSSISVMIPEMLGVPYEEDRCRLVKAWFHFLGCCSGFATYGDSSSMFCTEVLACVFERLDVIKERDPSYHRRSGSKNDEKRRETKGEGYTPGCLCWSGKGYGHEDWVLEDYVHFEEDHVKDDSWLWYDKIVVLNVRMIEINGTGLCALVSSGRFENRTKASMVHRRSFLGPCPEKEMLRAKCGSVGLSNSIVRDSSATASFRSDVSKIEKIETNECSDFVDIFSTKSKLFVVPIFLENRRFASTQNRRSFFGPCLEKAMLRAKCGSVGLSKSVVRNSYGTRR
jgi:hypothetical protein